MQASATGRGRSITEVLFDIGRNLEDILRSEIRLAQSEVRERLISLRFSALLVVAGLAASLLSGFFLMLTLLYALRRLIPPWAAALCICGALALFAAIALRLGMRDLTAPPARKTAGSVKENLEWARQQTK